MRVKNRWLGGQERENPWARSLNEEKKEARRACIVLADFKKKGKSYVRIEEEKGGMDCKKFLEGERKKKTRARQDKRRSTGSADCYKGFCLGKSTFRN